MADWPDATERQLHRFLAGSLERGEWFREGELLSSALGMMADKERGLAALLLIAGPTKKRRERRKKSAFTRRREQRLEQLSRATVRAFDKIGPKLGAKV